MADPDHVDSFDPTVSSKSLIIQNYYLLKRMENVDKIKE